MEGLSSGGSQNILTTTSLVGRRTIRLLAKNESAVISGCPKTKDNIILLNCKEQYSSQLF